MNIKELTKKINNHIYWKKISMGWYNKMDDESFLKMAYKRKLGKTLNLEHPVTFNEKLQWLKLYDRKPEYTTMADKFEAKKYVERLIGKQYIVPTIGVWDKLDDINFDKLPVQFVLKSTHDSGGVVICKDKSEFNITLAKKKLSKSLKQNYFWTGREWPYKNLQPRIIAEEYLSSFGSTEAVEYKIFCFNGEPKLFLVCKGEGHGSNRTNDFYDVNFNHIPVTVTNPNAKEECKRPKEYEELITLAKKLSQNIPQLRVDFYVVNTKIYFGELTFFHDLGFCQFNPEKYDEEFGKFIVLPKE